jgi:(p)ppGpp synthase/HD superfamily hydrolase
MKSLLDEFGLNNTNELFEQLGLGERLAPLVAKLLLQSSGKSAAEQGKPTPIAIAGTEGLMVSYARCCHPIPGDDIMGYLSAGRGVVIHRNVCGNLGEFRKQPNKWIAVAWQPGIERQFSAEIRVEVDNRPGVLAEVAARIAETGSNIEQVSIDEGEEDAATLLLSILVRDRRHLAEVLRDVRRMTVVKKLSRTCT